MKNKIPALIIFSVLISFLFSMNSCKEKGCTDPGAINYNSVADDDDGSCEYCKSKTETSAEIFSYMADNSGSGPHMFQNVALFRVKQIKNTYSYSQCGNNSCYFLVYIESLVPETMTFSYSLQVNGNVNFNTFKNITVPPNQITYADSVPSNMVSNPCGQLMSSSLFVSPSGSIFYH